jgi:hypothetical protein
MSRSIAQPIEAAFRDVVYRRPFLWAQPLGREQQIAKILSGRGCKFVDVVHQLPLDEQLSWVVVSSNNAALPAPPDSTKIGFVAKNAKRS